MIPLIFHKKNVFFVGVLLLLLYLFSVFYVTMQQETGMERSALFGRGLLALFIGCFLYYVFAFRVLSNGRMQKILYSWLLLILSLSCVSLIRTGIIELNFIFLLSIFPYLTFVFFHFSFSKQLVSEKFAVKCYVVFLIVVCITFMNIQSVVNSIRSGFSGFNHAYYAILALPMCLLSKRKVICVGCSILTLYVALISMKRTGIIAMLGGVFLFFFLKFIFSKNKLIFKKRNLYLLLVLIVLVVSAVLLLMNGDKSGLFEYLLSRFQNISSDGGSGRSGIYLTIINDIFSSTLIDFLLGHGGNRVIQDFSFRLTAHCDFLEVAYDYGVFAFLFLLVIHWALIKKMVELIKIQSPYAFAFTYSYSCFFLFSTLSHIMIYTYFILLLPFWALVFSKTSNI